jgi:hypothetical protein
MSNLSSFLNLPSLIAGYAIAIKDLVLFGPMGRAYPAVRTDYAVVANAGAAVVAQASIIATTTPRGRHAVYVDTDGSIYVANPYSTLNGTKIYKYSAMGLLLGTLDIDTAAADMCPMKIGKLSNGDFVVTSHNAGILQFAIFTAKLVLVAGPTTGGTMEGPANKAECYDMITLSGGGFAWCYTNNSVTTDTRLAIFSNTGSVVYAATTVGVIASGISGFYAMVQLSNGNIVIAKNNTNGGTQGIYYMIRSNVGASVLAITYEVVTTGSYVPLISAMTNNFCIATHDSTNVLAYVYNLAGTRQGAGMSVASSQVWGAANYRAKLLNDGTQFWLLANLTASSTYIWVSKIPAGGTNYVNTMTDIATGQAVLDAFIDTYSGLLVIARAGGASAELNKVATYNLTTGTTIENLTGYGTAPTTNSGTSLAAVQAGGDFAMVSVYDYSSTSGNYICVTKFASSAIVGVAGGAAAAAATVYVQEAVGTYANNLIVGTGTKAFDHTTGTNIQGNKGTAGINGSTMRGM